MEGETGHSNQGSLYKGTDALWGPMSGLGCWSTKCEAGSAKRPGKMDSLKGHKEKLELDCTQSPAPFSGKGIFLV